MASGRRISPRNDNIFNDCALSGRPESTETVDQLESYRYCCSQIYSNPSADLEACQERPTTLMIDEGSVHLNNGSDGEIRTPQNNTMFERASTSHDQVFPCISPSQIVEELIVKPGTSSANRRKRRQSVGTALLTSADYLHQLEASKRSHTCVGKKKKQKTKNSELQPDRIAGEDSKESISNVLKPSASDNDPECLYCIEPFSRSADGEEWISEKCGKWSYAEYTDGCLDRFICDFCK